MKVTHREHALRVQTLGSLQPGNCYMPAGEPSGDSGDGVRMVIALPPDLRDVIGDGVISIRLTDGHALVHRPSMEVEKVDVVAEVRR